MAIFISKQLKYFMTAMEHKSISKAAETLFLTRTPLSKILSDLEQFLDCKLFDRQYNTLVPTQFAWDLYYDLLPIYEAHEKLENRLKKSGSSKAIKVVFDVSFPEILYRIVVAIFDSETSNYSVACEKELITDQCFEVNKNKDNIIIVSLRTLSPVVHYNHNAWECSGFSLMASNKLDQSHSSIRIYLWKDMFSGFFEEKIHEKLGECFDSIEIVKHNFDLSTLLYKVYQGEGCMLMTHKVASIYKTEHFKLLPVNNARLKVNLYHNFEPKNLPALKVVKKTLLQFL